MLTISPHIEQQKGRVFQHKLREIERKIWSCMGTLSVTHWLQVPQGRGIGGWCWKPHSANNIQFYTGTYIMLQNILIKTASIKMYPATTLWFLTTDIVEMVPQLFSSIHTRHAHMERDHWRPAFRHNVLHQILAAGWKTLFSSQIRLETQKNRMDTAFGTIF